MWTDFHKKISNRIQSLGKSELLYIVPTQDGLKLLLLNLILLIIGLVYANNYVLLFNFILFCLFLGSMFYTHFNLLGLRLTAAQLNPVHANDNGVLTLYFKTSSGLGHFFLRLRLAHPLIDLPDKKHTFSFKSGDQNSHRVDIPIRGIRRGEIGLSRLCIETLFPFHLFRCFVYFEPHLNIVVYPERLDLKIHLAEYICADKRDEGDDFSLNDFKLGDPLKRVHWKKLAQSSRWYSKTLTNPEVPPVILSLNKDLIPVLNIEDQLSSICFALYQHHYQNIKYGLTLGKVIISADHSNYHLGRCLRALADYED